MGTACLDCGYVIHPDELVLYLCNPIYLQRNASQFKAAYGQPMQKCLRLARLTAFSRLPKLAALWERVRLCGYVDLPFQAEVFATHASLSRQTEFLLNENSALYVVYND